MGVNAFVRVGSRIKSLRMKMGIKQKDMAAQLGIPPSTYANYENNHREPTAELLDRIADHLGVTTAHLLGFDEPDHFVSYLESIGYLIDVEEVIQKWHWEEVVQDKEVVGQAKVVDESTFTVTIQKDGETIVLNEDEFENLKSAMEKAVQFELFRLNHK